MRVCTTGTCLSCSSGRKQPVLVREEWALVAELGCLSHLKLPFHMLSTLLRNKTCISYCISIQSSSGINLKCQSSGLPGCPRCFFLHFASGDYWYFQNWCIFPSMTSEKMKIKNVKTSNKQRHVKTEPDVYLYYVDSCKTRGY